MGIFDAFSGFANMATVAKLVGWFVVLVIVCGSLAAIALMIAVKKQKTKIIEIDMQNKRLREFSGRDKKTRTGVRKFWAGKLKRYLPNFQQKDLYLKGKQDTVILLKDDNGMFHTLRIPTMKQLKKWYDVVYGIDINTAKDKEKLRNIYGLPSPHEDLDWLANQIAEAKTEFKVEHWWQSPTIAYIGCGFICMIMFIATMVLSRQQ